MAETSNIASVAGIVSERVFRVFGWKSIGPTDVNTPCLLPDKHGKKSHPADVVFQYDDIYEDRAVSVLTDLKSYAANTVSAAKVGSAIRTLGMSVECAATSVEWRAKFDQSTGRPAEVIGMLFIYNHDGGYDANFDDLVRKVDPTAVEMPAGVRIHLLGPPTTQYLSAVALDLDDLLRKRKIEPSSETGFFYPHLVRAKANAKVSPVATVETLTSAWQIFCYPLKGKKRGSGCLVYYRGAGSNPDEFKYLFDYLFRFQLIEESTKIEFRLLRPEAMARSNFDLAKKSYASGLPGAIAVQQLLERIELETPPVLVYQLIHENLGMDRG